MVRTVKNQISTHSERKHEDVSDLIVSDNDDGVVVVCLNRPHARNALSRSLREELAAQLAAFEGDPAVGAVVLTGTDPAFCSGMDIKELQTDPASARSIGPRYRPVFETRKPLIGAINGAALTGGFELALACDWLIASENAVFGDSHTRLGLTPGWGLTVQLVEAVGTRRARQLIATGQVIDAPTAFQWGLVTEVVAHAELLSRAIEMGKAVAENNRNAVAAVLETIAEQRSIADSGAWAVEARHWIEPSGVTSGQPKPDES